MDSRDLSDILPKESIPDSEDNTGHSSSFSLTNQVTDRNSTPEYILTPSTTKSCKPDRKHRSSSNDDSFGISEPTIEEQLQSLKFQVKEIAKENRELKLEIMRIYSILSHRADSPGDAAGTGDTQQVHANNAIFM